MQPQPLYPAFLDLSGKSVLVVGGGRVGLRKARELAACGARLRVVSREFASGFDELDIERVQRPWNAGDEIGARLVVAATPDPGVNQDIFEACSRGGILCNVVDTPELCDFHVPAVAREGDVQVAVATGGMAPFLSSWMRRKLQEWLSGGVAELASLCGRIRSETRDTMPPAAREAFWKSIDPDELLRILRNEGVDACEKHLRALLGGFEAESVKKGRVVLVGAGPGHPDLITRMGLRALGRATALVHDRLVSRELLSAVPASCEIHPVGKTGFGKSHGQEDINALIVRLASEGHRVVRLKGGDPFVFGRGGEEIEACMEAGIEVEVVPGVSSSLSAPAFAGIPVTHRGLSRSFAVISGFHADGTTARIPDVETVVIMMPLHSMKSVRERFLQAGWDPETPCAAIHSGTNPDQRVVHSTVDDIDADLEREGMKSPIVVIAGAVAGWGRRNGPSLARRFAAPRGGLAG